MGGTFNPPHNAHLMMARAALAASDQIPQLDEVWFLPTGSSQYKRVDDATPAQRLAMVAAAVADEERINVCDLETRRNQTAYTLDTMRELIANSSADGQTSFVNLIGADLLLNLHNWYGADELMRLCSFAVFPRLNANRGLVEAAAERLRRDFGARIDWVKTELPDISSTELRARVHCGLSIEKYVPAAVQYYIDRERLYNPPSQLPRDDVVKILSETLSPHRFAHSLAVERKSVELAKIHNTPEDKAALAGLLHDCAKYLSIEDMCAEADRLGIETDEARRTSGELLHSVVGAAMLRGCFGVTDPDVLSAVRYHNTGRAGMPLLDSVVFLADKIEDTREPHPGLAEVRALAETDLVGAMILNMRGTIRYNESRGRLVHPDTPVALAYLESIKPYR
ncbi:hypothetical protein FACS1894184_04080 [Clostridia bacterium]|nr:hypothetical protein FACS1894184_04080 [Clostridia bacterium]